MVGNRRAVEDFIIVSNTPDAFAVRDHRNCPDGDFHHVGQYESFCVMDGQCIKRSTDGAVGFIVNTSADTLQVMYSPLDHRISFGPGTDFILPMEAKEIGAAPESVLWRVRRA